MKKESQASKIMKYIASHPHENASRVAKSLGVKVDSVYQATYLAKKKVAPLLKTIAVSTSDKSFAQNARMSKALFSDPPIRERPSKLTEAEFKKLPFPRIAYDDYGNVKIRMMGTPQWGDNVNHPPHYKAGGIETIDFIEAKSLGYNLGNVVKYITRADHKGNTLEDLKKAQWYLNREISNLAK